MKGAIITASHNEINDNGIKIITNTGGSISKEIEELLELFV